MSGTGILLLLQEADALHERTMARLAVLDASIGGDPHLDGLRRAARVAQRERRRVDEEVAAQEAVVAQLQARARGLDRHLYDGSVRNPAELVGMQHDLESVRAQVTSEEERELELMERAESAAAAEREALAAAESRAQDRAAGASAELAEAADLREELERQEAERAALAAQLSPPHVALYERVRARHRPAVVTLVSDTCGGCHIPFSNSEVRRVRTADQPVQCANCDRIVVS